MKKTSLLAAAALVASAFPFLPVAQARTVYRCVRDGSVSLSTAPEPGSRCVAKHFEDNPAKVPNLWGELGTVKLVRAVCLDFNDDPANVRNIADSGGGGIYDIGC